MVSGCSSADEHERLLWNRHFHPFNIYTEKKHREKLNYAERHKLWHGRPARDHGRDGRATKGCAIIQVVLYRRTITRSGACWRVRPGIGRGQAGGITPCMTCPCSARLDWTDRAAQTSPFETSQGRNVIFICFRGPKALDDRLQEAGVRQPAESRKNYRVSKPETLRHRLFCLRWLDNGRRHHVNANHS